MKEHTIETTTETHSDLTEDSEIVSHVIFSEARVTDPFELVNDTDTSISPVDRT